MREQHSQAVRLHCFIDGRVQGVCFREYTKRQARLHGVAGWVRNLPDGRVEAVFEGDPAAVNRLRAWAQEGPPSALVISVEAREEDLCGEHGFEIRA
jgi:acylphosphatase